MSMKKSLALAVLLATAPGLADEPLTLRNAMSVAREKARESIGIPRFPAGDSFASSPNAAVSRAFAACAGIW